MIVLRTNTAPVATLIPLSLKFVIKQFSIKTLLAATTLTPTEPLKAPLMANPRRTTLLALSVAAVMLIVTPVAPSAGTAIPPVAPVPLIVMDLVITTPPKPPGSRTLISPFTRVLDMVPASVLQGEVRLQGLVSSPTPDTKVRSNWA